MIDEGVYEEYAAALEAASDLASKAVIELEREIGHLTGDDLAQALAASYASIVGEYGQVAAEAAIEFYASVRDAASTGQSYDPVPAQGRSVETLSRDVGGVMETAQAALSDRLKNLGGMAIRRTMEQASDTIIGNARSDKAHPRWAIVPRMGACGWCIMLGSQGFVYGSDKTATSARHPWCKCVTVVDFDAENPSLKGYDEGGMYDRYLSCRKAIEQDAERRWDAMGDAEKARYGGNGRSDYDHYLRNRIVAEMNTRDREWLRTGEIPEIAYGKPRNLLTDSEKAAVKHLANNGIKVATLMEDAKAKANLDFWMLGDEYEAKNVTNAGSSISNQLKRVRVKAYKLNRADSIKAVFTCEGCTSSYDEVCASLEKRIRESETFIVLSDKGELRKISGN